MKSVGNIRFELVYEVPVKEVLISMNYLASKEHVWFVFSSLKGEISFISSLIFERKPLLVENEIKRT